jgi:hypothetical protein
MCHVEYIIYEAVSANENTKKTKLSGKKDLPENGCRTRACSVLRMGIKKSAAGSGAADLLYLMDFDQILLIVFARRATLREALFLWKTPLLAALSIVASAAMNAAAAASLSPASTAL